MFENRTWYNEVAIIAILINMIGSFTQIFIPFPLSYLAYVPLLVLLAIWRLRKKTITGREFITIFLILNGLNLATSLIIPWPYSYLVSFALLFLIIWVIHKSAIKRIQNKSSN